MALPPDALRRITTAQSWTTRRYATIEGPRCILGHAEDWYWDAATGSPGCRCPELLKLREQANDSWLNWPPLIGVRFDHLAERVGLARAAYLVRLRAARLLEFAPAETTHEVWKPAHFEAVHY